MIGDNDLNVFFNPSDFGDTAKINGSTVNGVFFNGFESVQSPIFDAEVMSNAPYFLATTADISGSGLDTKDNRAVYINQKSYLAKSINPDGSGLTKVELMEAT